MSQLEAKNEILSRLKAGKPASQPLPEVPMYPYPGDPVENYIKRLIAFDGRAVKFKNRAEALAWLSTQPEMEAAKNVIYSSVLDVKGNFTEEDLSDLREAAKIQTCVTEGELAVGETGSMWVTDKSLGHAVCGLLCRRIFVLIDSKNIIGGLHEAYAKLNLKEIQYGSYFSGPSATADIEAVRITGAQGPLAFTALIYNCDDAPEKPELLTSPNADSSIWEKDM